MKCDEMRPLPLVVLRLFRVFLMVSIFFNSQVQAETISRFNLHHNRPLNIKNVSEKWVNDWIFTGSLLKFPGGGEAGFYRRLVRARKGRTALPTGRVGVLCLYPETRYKPVLIYKKYIRITRTTSRLLIGVAANKNPIGEWILRVFINKNQLGRDVLVSGKQGWQDLAFELSEFLGQTVDIDIGAYSYKTRPSQVYIDYIYQEDPIKQSETGLNSTGVENVNSLIPSVGEIDCFDGYYIWFLETLWQREEIRQQFLMERYGEQYYCPRKH